MLRVGLMTVVLLMTVGCRTVPIAGECPDSAELKCMTQKQCVEDKRRGCMVCQCEDPFQTDPARKVQQIEQPDMVP